MPKLKKQSYEIRRKKANEYRRLKRSLEIFKTWEPQVKVENDHEDQDEARLDLDDDPFIKSEPIETEELDSHEDLQDLISLGEAVRVKVENGDEEDIGMKKVFQFKAWTTKRAPAKTKKAKQRKGHKALKKNNSSETPKKRRPYKKTSKMTAEELAEHKKARRRKNYKKVSEMTPEELKEYQDRCRKRYKKVSEMTPEELEAYNVYKERMRLRYHSTKAAREEGESGESRSWRNKRVSEMTPKELEAYDKDKEKKRLAYKSKDVSDMTPEELEAYNAKKERARIRYHLTKAANGECKASKSSSWKNKRVSEMTPEELEAYNKWKERRKQKYKNVFKLDPEKVERERARKREEYHRKKTANMSEEEKNKYYEMYVMKMARRLELAEKRKSVSVKKQAKRGTKLKLEKKPLDPEEEQRLKRERYQRMIRTRIERMAQMTEEEKEELRRRKYERRMALLAAYPPEEQEKRMKLWERSDRSRRNSISWYQRMKNEGKYSELQQKCKRKRQLRILRRKLRVQELVKQGKSYEEIQIQLETPRARERRLTYLRRYKAKKGLREKLEADGVPPEEIQRQVEEFAKTYKPTTPLKPYKPRKKYLLEPIKPEEIALLESTQNPSPSTKPEKTKKAKPGKKYSDSAATTTFSSFSVKLDTDATPSTSYQNQYQYQPIPTQTFQPEQQTYFSSAQEDQQNYHSQCQSESSIYSSVNDADIDEASSGQPSCSNYDDDYHDDDNGVVDDSSDPVCALSASASVPSSSTSTINYDALALPGPSTQAASGLLSLYFPRVTNSNQLELKPLPPPAASFSPLSNSGKKVGRPIGRSTAKSQVLKNTTCDICGCSYSRAEFLRHMRNLHHPYFQNFHCTICCQRFKPPAFQKHFQDVHIANGDVSWDSLDPVFRPRQRRQVLFNAGTCVGDRADPCEICGKIVDRRNMIAHKARFHNPYYNERTNSCSLCQKVITKAHGQTFNEHFLSAHPDIAEGMLRNPNSRKKRMREKKHICDECGQGFSQLPLMRYHLYYMHGAGALEENFYKCQDCSQERLFKYKEQYKNHYKDIHPGTYAPLMQCPLCPLRIGTKREKNEHIKEMHPDRCWPCEYCNVVRISEVALLTHYLRHCPKITPEEKLRWKEEKGEIRLDKMEVKCELCNVELVLDSLQRHVQDMHQIKEKDYPCWKCEKTFKKRLYLGVHLMEIHDMQPEEWRERVAKVNVPNLETVKSSGKKYDPPDWRKKKRICRGREPKKYKESSGNAVSDEDQLRTEMKNKRRGRRRKAKAPSPKCVVNEDDVEEEELNGEKFDPDSEEESMSSESDDDMKNSRRKTKEPRQTQPNQMTRKSTRTRTLTRKSFKDYDSDEDRQAKIKSRSRATRRKPNMLIVDDDVKLSKMKSSVTLLKMELDTVCYYHGIQMKDRKSIDHLYT